MFLLVVHINDVFTRLTVPLLASLGLVRTKYFSSFSFFSTSVAVSLLLNGNITPALILEKLVGYGNTLLVLLFDIPFMVFTTVDSLIFKA